MASRSRSTNGKRKRAPRRVKPEERAAVEPNDTDARKELRRAFGRAEAEEDLWVPTDLGCPHCRGVLYVAALGERGWLSFRCRVGHAFASDSLIAAKESQLEEALWDSIEVLDEIVQIYEALEARRRANPTAPRDPIYERRIAVARKHGRQLRRLIAGEGPAPVQASDPTDKEAHS